MVYDVTEVIVLEYSDDENDNMQCTTASGAPSASSATLTWEDKLCRAKGKFFFITVGLKMKALISGDKQNGSDCVVTCGTIAEYGPHVVDGRFL
jgi:hypothetical protein